MHLTVEAHVAPTFDIQATGRDAEICATMKENLIVDTYRDVLTRSGNAVPALHLRIHNEIPLGMGCGSSAAALLAGVALADHFGGLNLTPAEIVAEASRLEGHPDNVAACWFGGFTVSAMTEDGVKTATFPAEPDWQLLLALPATGLATKTARALLPDSYPKSDAVFNVQRTSLLVAAFAQGRLDLLATAMQDRMHQPYRTEACPLLTALLPLAAEPEIAGVALSGAGPSVLLILAADTAGLAAETRVGALLGASVEVLPLRIARGVERTLL
jgi:homoserine kinase